MGKTLLSDNMFARVHGSAYRSYRICQIDFIVILLWNYDNKPQSRYDDSPKNVEFP